MSSHGGAVADASPYLGSICPVVMAAGLGPAPELIAGGVGPVDKWGLWTGSALCWWGVGLRSSIEHMFGSLVDQPTWGGDERMPDRVRDDDLDGALERLLADADADA